MRLDPVHVALKRDRDPMPSQRSPRQQLSPADLVALRGVLAHQLRRRAGLDRALGNPRAKPTVATLRRTITGALQAASAAANP